MRVWRLIPQSKPKTPKRLGSSLSGWQALEIVDPEFVANRLRPFASTIVDGLGQVALSQDPWSLKDSHRGLVKNIGAANGLISLWLSYGRDRADRKSLARVPAGVHPSWSL